MTTASGGPAVAGAVTKFHGPIDLAEGDSLAGKDLRVAIRRVSAPQAVVHASLEAVAVTVAEGEWSFTLSAEQTAHLTAPDQVEWTAPYYLEFYVPGEKWAGEEPIQFPVRRAAANLSTGG